MNKKEVADFRKEFKENSLRLKLQELYSLYIKKDDGAIIHKAVEYFESMDIEKKELYFNNFKKIMSSSIDTKLFELDFTGEDSEDYSQKLLVEALDTSDTEVLQDNLDKMINKMLVNYKYDTDIVVNFIRGEYYRGNKKRNVDADEAIDDAVHSFKFVLCSVNKIEFPKRAMIFDYSSREIVPNSALEAVINLNAPMDGFLFPAFENGCSNVNKVMYYCSKAKDLNLYFIEDILNCTAKHTAEDEREFFHSILATVAGEKVKPEVIQDIYTKISERFNEEDEVDTVGISDMKKIFTESGITEIDHLEEIVEQTCGSNHDFKIQNIIPDFKTKSIKISNDVADITIMPQNLNSLRHVIDSNGRKCILIEINDDVIINGLKLEPENTAS